MSNATGQQAIWFTPDAAGIVRELKLKRGDERTAIFICQFRVTAQVGWGQRTAWFLNSFDADTKFDEYVQQAYEEGWQNEI